MAHPQEPSRPPDGPSGSTSGAGAWAAPDAPGEPHRPLAAPAEAARTAGGPEGFTGADSHRFNAVGVRLPAPLRPMAVADVLDGGFTILKSRPRTIYGIVLPIMLPVLLVQAWLQRGLYSGSVLFPAPGAGSAVPSGGADVYVVGSILMVAVVNLTLYLVGAGIARVVSAWYAGGDIGPVAALRAVAGRSGQLLGLWVLQGLLTLVCVGLSYCLIGLPALVAVVAFLSFTAPIVMIEKVGPIEAMRRSWRLAIKRAWPVIGITLLIALVQSLVSFGLTWASTGLLIGTFGGSAETVGLVAVAVVGALVTLLVEPYVVGATVLLYLDQRVRSEGLDLELEAADAFG